MSRMTTVDDSGTEPALPFLIVVTGSPASGKTTIAESLAESMRLPLITKDGIKELLYDSLEGATPSDSHRLGFVAVSLMQAWAKHLLQNNVSLVLESNFKRSLSVEGLEELFSISRPVLVQCVAPTPEVLDRYVERSEKGERHPVHDDANHVDELRVDLEKGEYDLTGVDAPTLLVNTSDTECNEIVDDLIIRIRTIQRGEPVQLEADPR